MKELAIIVAIGYAVTCGSVNGDLFFRANEYAPTFVDTVYLDRDSNAVLHVGVDYDPNPRAMAMPFAIDPIRGHQWKARLNIVDLNGDTLRKSWYMRDNTQTKE